MIWIKTEKVEEEVKAELGVEDDAAAMDDFKTELIYGKYEEKLLNQKYIYEESTVRNSGDDCANKEEMDSSLDLEEYEDDIDYEEDIDNEFEVSEDEESWTVYRR